MVVWRERRGYYPIWCGALDFGVEKNPLVTEIRIKTSEYSERPHTQWRLSTVVGASTFRHVESHEGPLPRGKRVTRLSTVTWLSSKLWSHVYYLGRSNVSWVLLSSRTRGFCVEVAFCSSFSVRGWIQYKCLVIICLLHSFIVYLSIESIVLPSTSMTYVMNR